MIYVEVWQMSGPQAQNQMTAVLAWDGSRWHADPPSGIAVNLLEDFQPGMDPVQFLAGLHKQYRSAYLRVSQPKQGVPPSLSAGSAPATPSGTAGAPQTHDGRMLGVR